MISEWSGFHLNIFGRVEAVAGFHGELHDPPDSPAGGPLMLNTHRPGKLKSPAPRPDAFTLCCAGLVVVPSALFLVASVALVTTTPEQLAAPAGLGAVLGLFGGTPLLVAEYYAVVRRSARAASLLGCFFLYLAVAGSLGWLGGLLGVLHLIKSPNPDSMSAVGFAIYSVFLAGLIVTGVGHLRWYRILRAATDALE